MGDNYMITVMTRCGNIVFQESWRESSNYNIRERITELEQDGFFFEDTQTKKTTYYPKHTIATITARKL